MEANVKRTPVIEIISVEQVRGLIGFLLRELQIARRLLALAKLAEEHRALSEGHKPDAAK